MNAELKLLKETNMKCELHNQPPNADCSAVNKLPVRPFDTFVIVRPFVSLFYYLRLYST